MKNSDYDIIRASTKSCEEENCSLEVRGATFSSKLHASGLKLRILISRTFMK